MFNLKLLYIVSAEGGGGVIYVAIPSSKPEKALGSRELGSLAEDVGALFPGNSLWSLFDAVDYPRDTAHLKLPARLRGYVIRPLTVDEHAVFDDTLMVRVSTDALPRGNRKEKQAFREILFLMLADKEWLFANIRNPEAVCEKIESFTLQRGLPDPFWTGVIHDSLEVYVGRLSGGEEA